MAISKIKDNVQLKKLIQIIGKRDGWNSSDNKLLEEIINKMTNKNILLYGLNNYNSFISEKVTKRQKELGIYISDQERIKKLLEERSY